jgi:YHS domain-containing protein
MTILVLSGLCPSRIRVDGYKVFVRKARSRIDWGMNILVGWVIRFLLLALVLRAVVSFVRGLLSGASGSRSKGTSRSNRPVDGVSLVKDSICGTYIERSHAVSIRTGGTVHYFCSETCKRMFHQSV